MQWSFPWGNLFMEKKKEIWCLFQTRYYSESTYMGGFWYLFRNQNSDALWHKSFMTFFHISKVYTWKSVWIHIPLDFFAVAKMFWEFPVLGGPPPLWITWAESAFLYALCELLLRIVAVFSSPMKPVSCNIKIVGTKSEEYKNGMYNYFLQQCSLSEWWIHSPQR